MRMFQCPERGPLRAGSLLLILAFATPPLIAQSPRIERQLLEKAKSAATVPQYSAVIGEIESAMGDRHPESIRQYLKKLLAWVYNRRGEAYSRLAGNESLSGKESSAKEHDAAALKDFEQSLKLDPTRWKSLHNRAVCYALSGRFDEAERDLSRVIEQRPEYVNAWFNRAEIRYDLGKFGEAVGDYTEAIRLQSEDADFYTGRGHAYFQLGRLDEAAADYDRAVQLTPGKAEYYANRGDAYRALGRWEEAAKDYRRAVELDSRFGRGYQSAAWLMATCPDPQYRNAALAVQAAEKAVALDGGDDYVYLDTLAAAYANAGQFDKALKTVQRAVARSPKPYRPAVQRRVALYQAGKPYRQKMARKVAYQARRP